MNNKSPLIANLHNERNKQKKKMKNDENWRKLKKMKKNDENENQIGAINHSQTLTKLLLLQNS